MISGKPTKNNFKDIAKQLNEFKKSVIKIGLPKDTSGKYEDGTSVIDVGILHEYGSITKGIPQRSFLRMPLFTNRDKIKKMIFKEVQKVEQGKTTASVSLKKLGAFGEGLSKASFRDNNWKANTAFTIKKKGSSTPLIDTGQLRKSITFVVEKS